MTETDARELLKKIGALAVLVASSESETERAVLLRQFDREVARAVVEREARRIAGRVAVEGVAA